MRRISFSVDLFYLSRLVDWVIHSGLLVGWFGGWLGCRFIPFLHSLRGFRSFFFLVFSFAVSLRTRSFRFSSLSLSSFLSICLSHFFLEIDLLCLRSGRGFTGWNQQHSDRGREIVSTVNQRNTTPSDKESRSKYGEYVHGFDWTEGEGERAGRELYTPRFGDPLARGNWYCSNKFRMPVFIIVLIQCQVSFSRCSASNYVRVRPVTNRITSQLRVLAADNEGACISVFLNHLTTKKHN